MALITPLKALTILASEQSTVIAAVGSEDATGMLSAVVTSLQEVQIQLTRLAAYLPAGTNLTAINTALTTIA